MTTRLRESSTATMSLSTDGAWGAHELCLGFVPSMVAKAVCELGVPDILAAHDPEPMSALHIAQLLSPPPTRPLHEAAEQLDRMMRCLSAHDVFKVHVGSPADTEDTMPFSVRYTSTPLSKWLEPGATLNAYFLFHMGAPCQDRWNHLSQTLLHGSAPAVTATDSADPWLLAAAEPQMKSSFNSAMVSLCQFAALALHQHYDGFQNGIRTLVDVGGGKGFLASSIATHHPSIKVINFDIPAVIAMAPAYPGVQHVGGDMFQSVPQGDAIFMKSVFHDWPDEDCIKILTNCRKVLPSHGKLIIMDAVLDLAPTKDFQKRRVMMDMLLLAQTAGGRERTKKQWEDILTATRFTIHRILDLPCPQCVIEAVPTTGLA